MREFGTEEAESLKERTAERRWAEEALSHTLEKVQKLSRHTLQAQEDDYRFISRELHDHIANSVTAVKMMLERLKGEVCLEGSGHGQAVRDAVSRLTKIALEARRLSRHIRSEILDELGLTAALQSYVRDFQERTGIRTDFSFKTPDAPLSPDLEIHLYRIVQEALNNVSQHASASLVVIRLEASGGGLNLSIMDNGVGFPWEAFAAGKKKSQGIGLISMQERTNLISGTLEIASSPGNGTNITVRAPVSS
jgi:signal transduction histidine kinase